MALPKVSIVIPTYKPGFFEQCLRSAIGQTYLNTEILVSDNCPTEAIRDICSKYPSVIYQRNTAIRTDNVISTLFSGKGVYIKPLFDDDLLHPFAIERMVAAMELHTEVQMVYSRSAQINAHNRKDLDRRPFEKNGLMHGRDMIRAMGLEFRNFIGELSSIMFRRDRIWQLGTKRVFSFGEKDFLVGLADVAFYFALVQGGSAYYIDEELSYFRWDMSIESNSNPATNPHFGQLGADWIDLLIESLRQGYVTKEEVLSVKELVNRMLATGWGVFPQVQQAQQVYTEFCQSLIVSQHDPVSQTHAPVTDANRKISIFIPVYNGEKFIAGTLESALKQTFTDFEIICVDDGSTDSSFSILQEFAARDARVRVFKTPSNMGGVSKVLNYSLHLMQGAYFVYSSQDDLFSTDWLEKMHARAIETGADAVIPDLVFHYANNPTSDRSLVGLHGDRNAALTNREAVQYSLNWEIPGNALWNANLIKKYGFEDFGMNADEFSVRVFFLHCNKIVFSEGQFYYRQDNEQAITKKMSYRIFDFPYTQYRLYQFLKQNDFPEEIVRQAAVKVMYLMTTLRQKLDIGRGELSEEDVERAEARLGMCTHCLKRDPMFSQVI